MEGSMRLPINGVRQTTPVHAVVIATALLTLPGQEILATTIGGDVIHYAGGTAATPAYYLHVEQDVQEAVSPVEKLHTLRRITELTGDELGDLMQVSRRTIHHWLNGAPLQPSHENHLSEVYAALLAVYNEDPHSLRQRLLAPTRSGRTVLSLFRTGPTDEAYRILLRTKVASTKEPSTSESRDPLSDPLTLLSQSPDTGNDVALPNARVRKGKPTRLKYLG
jgi:hypothetical protein